MITMISAITSIIGITSITRIIITGITIIIGITVITGIFMYPLHVAACMTPSVDSLRGVGYDLPTPEGNKRLPLRSEEPRRRI